MTFEEFNKLVGSKKNTVIVNRGIGPLSLLGIAFVIMKITGSITWSWWWVLAPFWIPVCLALAFLGLAFMLIAIAANKTNGNVKETTNNSTPKEDTPKSEVKEKPKATAKGEKKTSKKTTNGEESTRKTKAKNE